MRATRSPLNLRKRRWIGILTPSPVGSSLGNSVTARRYARILRSLGFRVSLIRTYLGQHFDALIALHARKSGRAALSFRRLFPARPLIVVLAGTDLYRDIKSSKLAQQALLAASWLVTLQPAGIQELPAPLRTKTTSIIQSAEPVPSRRKKTDTFGITVIGHMRYVKDPLRAAYALRLIPKSIPVRLTQAGRALEARYAELARRKQQLDPRYRWLGELKPTRARSVLAAGDLMIISSRMEGGANAIVEAIMSDVPVVASRISGNVGLLGCSYPGYYKLADTKGLAALMKRAATDRKFYSKLVRACRKLRPQFFFARERRAWAAVLDKLLAR